MLSPEPELSIVALDPTVALTVGSWSASAYETTTEIPNAPARPEALASVREVEKKSKLDRSAFFAMIEIVRERHPHVKVVATTLREVHSTSRHSWSAVAWIDGQTHVAPTAELDVLDRVGGGDGFASGFFYGLMSGEAPEEAVKLGWAHGALLTTFPGDTTMASVAQVRAFASGGSARIQR